MDPKAVQSHGHNAGLQQGGHGTEEHHHDHEKKSVLTKVKAKAKKIKDTIKKHGHHDHGHEDHRHIPDDHDLDQEDTEDEEIAQDPEIHGAPIYDSAAVTSGTMPGKVKTSERPRVNLGGANVMGEKHHHEPRVVVVSPATETNQSRSTGPARTFVGEERAEQINVNLVRPMGLEADPHAPGNRHPSYASSNYQSKVIGPTGAGGVEMDINPVHKSLERMTIHNEPKPIPEPKILPTIAETQYPSVGSNKQYVPEMSTPTKTLNPSAQSHGHNLPQLSGEIKTQYPKSHDQVMPDLAPKVLPTVTETQYPSAGSHQQFLPEHPTTTKAHYPSAQGHGQNLPGLSSEIETHYPRSHDQVMPGIALSTKTHETYPSARRHDQNLSELPSATKTHYPSTGGHGQFSSELPISSGPKPQYSSARNHDHFIQQHSSATETHYPSTGTHAQFAPEFPTEHKPHHPSRIHDQFMPSQHSSATEAQYPSAKSHDQLAPEFSTQSRSHGQFVPDLPTEPKPHHPSTRIHDQFMPSQHSSATETPYPSAGSHDQFAPDFSTQMKTGQTLNNPTIMKTEDQPQPHYESMEKPSNQSSYTDKISSATSAIADKAIGAKNVVADKAIGAKNVVASKLGYGETDHSNETSGENQPSQSSYTEKISSATSAIADKAASAKNTVASKLGFSESGEREENVMRRPEEEKVEGGSSTMSGSAAEYGKRIAESLTEKLAPVYGNAVKSEASAMEHDKGVSVKDYLAEKMRPGAEDRALSEVISETLHKKGDEEEEEAIMGEHRDVKGVVSDAVHKRGEEEPDERRGEGRRRVPLGKVTESEEVKRRLGGEDEETERWYEEKYANAPGEGVVDKVMGMVGNWFTKPEEENQSSQGDLSRNSGAEVEQVNKATGGRRLQESSH